MIQHTTMALAFANLKLPKRPALIHHRMATRIGEALDRYQRNRKGSKDWTARLSYRTARMLASKGVPLQ